MITAQQAVDAFLDALQCDAQGRPKQISDDYFFDDGPRISDDIVVGHIGVIFKDASMNAIGRWHERLQIRRTYVRQDRFEIEWMSRKVEVVARAAPRGVALASIVRGSYEALLADVERTVATARAANDDK